MVLLKTPRRTLEKSQSDMSYIQTLPLARPLKFCEKVKHYVLHLLSFVEVALASKLDKHSLQRPSLNMNPQPRPQYHRLLRRGETSPLVGT